MSRKKRRKKSPIDRKTKVMFFKVATVAFALVAVVLVSIYATKPKTVGQQEITITKEYQPGEEVANSIKMNDTVTKGIDGAVMTDKDALASDESLAVNATDTSAGSDSGQNKNNSSGSGNDSAVTSSEATVQNSAAEGTTGTSAGPTSDASSQQPDATKEDGSELVDVDDTEIPNGLTEEEQIQYVKDKWVDNMIHENSAQIDQNDLSQGASIYNSLDTEYLFGLAKDGLTPDEKVEAENYLKDKLGQDQYELAMVLYNKYVGLVN